MPENDDALQRADWPLEPSSGAMREAIDLVARRIIDHVDSLPEQPAWGTEDAADVSRAVKQARERVPQHGAELEPLLEYLFSEAIPRTYNTAGPGYMAYIPGGGLFDSCLASWIADAVNRYVGVFDAAPVLSQLEANVVAWFAEIIGHPSKSHGFLTSGGSLANLSGLVTARREKLGNDLLGGVIYTSDQIHHSVLKAAAIAGFAPEAVRVLPSDSDFRMDVDSLRAAAEADRTAGLSPFLVVGSGGTTNSGAVDDLDAIADAAADLGLWFHVDAAYGGFFAMTERGGRTLAGLGRADSVVLDPHKSLFLPYGVGCLLVRDGEALRRAHAIHADYMPPMQDDADLVDFCEISPELSRGFRGLKVWLPLKRHGLSAFRDSLDEKIDLAEAAEAALRAMPDVEIVAGPQLSIVAWRWCPKGAAPDQLDELNRRLLGEVNTRQRVYLTGTRLNGEFVIRICVLSFRTHADRLEAGLDDIRRGMETLGAQFEGASA